jgi:hypothetical protein
MYSTEEKPKTYQSGAEVMGASIERVLGEGPQLVLVQTDRIATVFRRDRGAFSWAEPGVYRRVTEDGYACYTAVDQLGRMRAELSVMLEDDAPAWKPSVERILEAVNIQERQSQLRLL